MKVKVSDSLDNVLNENVVTPMVTDRQTDRQRLLILMLLIQKKIIIPLQMFIIHVLVLILTSGIIM